MGNIPGVLAAHINSCLEKTLHKAKRKGGKIWCTKKVGEVHRQASKQHTRASDDWYSLGLCRHLCLSWGLGHSDEKGRGYWGPCLKGKPREWRRYTAGAGSYLEFWHSTVWESESV